MKFLPIHLVANGYLGTIKVGDVVHFTCTVIDEPEYLLETIRAVAIAGMR